MALDHALMARARSTGESVLRVYSWAQPTLSLGRNQLARGVYADDVLAARGIGVVRRPTGGRALLHHREITYSVTAPVTADDLSTAYQGINALLGGALARLGVPVEVARRTHRAMPPGALPCFAEPAPGELVVGGRKLVGSAQWRDAGALLQHGSILVDDDQVLLPSLMREVGTPAPPPATLREILGREPEVREVADTLFATVSAELDSDACRLPDGEVDALDRATLLEHYESSAWTWRR